MKAVMALANANGANRSQAKTLMAATKPSPPTTSHNGTATHSGRRRRRGRRDVPVGATGSCGSAGIVIGQAYGSGRTLFGRPRRCRPVGMAGATGRVGRYDGCAADCCGLSLRKANSSAGLGRLMQ